MPPSKYYETPEFAKLAAVWEKNLKKSGLENIEQADGKLKKWSSDKFGRRPEWNASKTEYYRLAGQFLHSHEFVNPMEKMVFEKHAEGLSYPEIIKALKKSRIRAVTPAYVRRVVESSVAIMLKDIQK